MMTPDNDERPGARRSAEPASVPDGDSGLRALPGTAQALGYAGLLPQIAVVGILLSHNAQWRFAALAFGYAYAAMILSFLGGLWWGLAARVPGRAPAWTWVVAVLPTWIALVTAVPWMVGDVWPWPSLWWLGLSLIGSLAVDHRFKTLGLAPAGWMALRIPLSLGLGGLTIATACL